jgi:6-phosphogluconolactonase
LSLPLRAEQIHRIEAELPAEEAADRYETELRRVFDLSRRRFPRFDLVLLGLGEEGHTASLFPGTTALEEKTRLVVANWVPKLAAERITLTYPVLNAAAAVTFLVAGADKAEIVERVLEGPPDAEVPASLVRPDRGELSWLLDRAAASRLDRPIAAT